MEQIVYQHRQSPIWPRVMLLVLLLLALIFLIVGSMLALVFIPGILMCVVYYFSLMVEVDAQDVRLFFGRGIIRRTIPRQKIAQAEQVRNSWWYGWGIRLTPHGWMWNISGLDAVELTYTNGKKFRIGTDQPQALLGVLRHPQDLLVPDS